MRTVFLIIFIIYINSLFAQSAGNAQVNLQLNQIAQVDLEPNNTAIVINIIAPSEAGQVAQVGVSNNSKWINFTSAIPPSSGFRNVSASIVSGNVPAGILLKLRVAPYTGNGAGQLGSAINEIQLNNTLKTIISNIGGSFTGNGINNGFNLTYLIEISDYKLLDFNNSQTLSISFTLSEI